MWLGPKRSAAGSAGKMWHWVVGSVANRWLQKEAGVLGLWRLTAVKFTYLSTRSVCSVRLFLNWVPIVFEAKA